MPIHNKNNIISIIGALDAEIEEYVKHLHEPVKRTWKHLDFYEGSLAGKKVVVCKSGVGKVFAALTTQKLIDDYDPACVLFTGVAGGLKKELNVGDIVVAKDCIQHDLDARGLGFPRGAVPYTDYRFFETDDRLRNLAIGAPSDHPIHEGRIVTGDHFMTKSEINEYAYLTDELKGDAVEMEGAAVGQVCTVNDIPFLIIRTVSDKADAEATVDFNQFLPIVAKNSFQLVNHVLKSY